MRRQDRGDDLMDDGAVQTREIFELANEAKFEECIPPACEYGCGAVGAVPRACGEASRGRVRCRDRTLREKGEREGDGGRSGGVDPVGHPPRTDAPSTEVRRDGNAQAEVLVSSQGMIRQDDGTEAGSDSTEWPDAAEESHAALPEVMTPVAWEFLNKLRSEVPAGMRAAEVRKQCSMAPRGRSAALCKAPSMVLVRRVEKAR